MRIPKPAKKVFTGVIFNVWQWPQKMYDGTTQTFEMLERAGNISVIPVVGNKILVSNELQPQYHKKVLRLIGGRAEKNENDFAAAKRELLEETGMVAKSWSLIHVDVPYFDKIDWTIYTYVAHDCKKIAKQNLDAGEKITTKAVNFNEFVNLIQSKKMYCGNFGFDVLKMKLEGKLPAFKKKIFKK